MAGKMSDLGMEDRQTVTVTGARPKALMKALPSSSLLRLRYPFLHFPISFPPSLLLPFRYFLLSHFSYPSSPFLSSLLFPPFPSYPLTLLLISSPSLILAFPLLSFIHHILPTSSL